ncbi:MAG TPA: prolyl oligopeptidase family serine peptidase [Stellaceae bacterium]|jgi:phospholipase/carboxylesterase|nr:prolyl oligopeptidase family serine peptidase [Stellaceae bacterium]
MLPSLSGPVLKPAYGGAPRQLVVLLHGVGADGSDLIGLAPYWAPLLPEAEFIAPDAPFPCDMAPFGRQWFSLQDRTPAVLFAAVRATAPIVDAFLDAALRARGLDDSRLALVGFSQGTMMSLYVGLRRSLAPAGIVGYSGALVGAETLEQEIRVRPPVLLLHGDADEVVPPRVQPLAVAALEAAGVPVESLTRPGLGHSIDEVGLQRGGAFLQRVLGGAPT